MIELLVVVNIMSILVAIAVPVISGIIVRAETEVCLANASELERIYQSHLELEVVEHNAVRFEQYMQEKFVDEICPSGGEISYVDGKVKCSIHSGDDEGEENEGVSVPYL